MSHKIHFLRQYFVLIDQQTTTYNIVYQNASEIKISSSEGTNLNDAYLLICIVLLFDLIVTLKLQIRSDKTDV